jgi:hypothetical protein
MLTNICRVRDKITTLYHQTAALYANKNLCNFVDQRVEGLDRRGNPCHLGLKPGGSAKEQVDKAFREEFDQVFVDLHCAVDGSTVDAIERMVDDKHAALKRYEKIRGYKEVSERMTSIYYIQLAQEAEELLEFIFEPVRTNIIPL